MSGLVDDLATVGEEMAQFNDVNMQDFKATMDFKHQLTSYVDQVHCEIPALTECRKIGF